MYIYVYICIYNYIQNIIYIIIITRVYYNVYHFDSGWFIVKLLKFVQQLLSICKKKQVYIEKKTSL